MLESKKLVPKTYANSRDYQVLLKMFDLLSNVIRVDIEFFVEYINPEFCLAKYLPLLASYVGYEYDYNEPVAVNRLIIKYFPYLIRNRGSETGIRLAVSLSVNAQGDLSDLEDLDTFSVEYVKEDGKINIYIYYPNHLSKVRDLIEVVRPAGARVELIPATPIKTIDQIQLSDQFEYNKVPYQQDRYDVSTLHRVGFGEVVSEADAVITKTGNDDDIDV